MMQESEFMNIYGAVTLVKSSLHLGEWRHATDQTFAGLLKRLCY